MIVHPFARDMRLILDNSYRVEAIVCLTRAYDYEKCDSPCGYYEKKVEVEAFPVLQGVEGAVPDTTGRRLEGTVPDTIGRRL